jgi:hypothetical protein
MDYQNRNIGFVIDKPAAPVPAPVVQYDEPVVPERAFVAVLGYNALLERELIARNAKDAGQPFYLQ